MLRISIRKKVMEYTVERKCFTLLPQFVSEYDSFLYL